MRLDTMMELTFWGTRGSIPSPGPRTVKYGGNTLCLELGFKGTDRRIIIDAGSGIRDLGNRLVSQHRDLQTITAEIFLTHTHLDHILGFPFFGPIYMPNSRLKIYGPVTCEDDNLEGVLGGQLSYRYFPVRQSELEAEIEHVDLNEGQYDLGQGIRLTAKYLNHTSLCLGYRFEYGGQMVCTAYDTEPFYNVFSDSARNRPSRSGLACEGAQIAREENQRLIDFVQGADLLIHDAQYTQVEYERGHVGWGHSSIEHAIETAERAGVKRLALYHHDPNRGDDELDTFSHKYCAQHCNGGMEVFFAREGMTVGI
jgi:phosphoribosyl 1,2-cyclic phosphodiesterase